MQSFTLHTLESAPAESKPLLEKSLRAFGSIPGLHAVMAESPETLEAYQQLHQLFTQTSFDAEELTVVWQTINVEHQCHYCVPAHTAIANMMKVDPALTEALRNGTAMPTAKLQALHDTTLAMLRGRGNLADAELDTFYAAGYGPKQVLEITLGMAQKVMSNYINHFAKTPADERFQQFAWSPK
ncbi:MULTISPECIES: carboxymuconolactone decarboxylase family protein [unclassified Oceanobacter]|jgi:alkylhydroperoxidase family enzyme|uniref:carboxymuconolactone decarboxylase family protein n=1 Tax=unclassified Oceanobacter TaxID=2620260 RepID=UPI002733BB0F|nr:MULTISPECIES: carboxymuconolactone decarboxylase family protein [unclassified Oceanobacter]MDP2506388.1 carboxymuconolactone decarboxylase family protein [Oceanobacter sp. 3_MG-2023]MDP2548805.1 carboxymuconolactone decarboxylase family protein [Oceanobacter sp. 4_MG-2023]